MKITFLKAPIALTKSYTAQADGGISKSSYPNVYEVTTISEDIKNLPDFAARLKHHAALGHCLLKGNPTRTLVCESRAGTTDSAAVSDWICLDVDGLDCATVKAFMKMVKLDHVSYVVQYSASYSITSTDLRCHVFIQLATPMAAPLIKQWLIQLNHQIPELRNAMGLTKTGNALLWALDISACQNDKLLYIAPPQVRGFKDPFKGERIIYVKGAQETLAITDAIASTAQNKVLTAKRVNELRGLAGYEPRKTTFKVHGAMEVMVKPDSCVVTEMKTERGFVYFNLNGGDSWAYFHAEENPEYIHNFKGEPIYLTKELLPEYWQQLTEQATAVRSDGTTYLAFCDRKTGAYWRGTHDGATDTLDIYAAKNETQVRHFAKQHGMPLGDYIPEWDLIFDPTSDVRVDIANKVVNSFQPTEYMKANKPIKAVKTCPKLIQRVIHHALGSDQRVTDHFMNWIAYITQSRDRSCSSWVLHGVTGTGKGVLFHKILRPMLGLAQTVIRNMEALDEKYNDYIEKSLIVFIDEVQTKALINEKGVMAKLRTFVTEERVSIRAMHAGGREVRNYSNWIFSSNMPDPVAINKTDRRTNVGRFQCEKLGMTQAEIDAIEGELQAFYHYLMAFKVDIDAVRTPLETEDRDTMISISESSADTVGSALLEGDFDFLLDQLPTTKAHERNAMESNKVADYKEVLINLHARTNLQTGACNVGREELRTIFEFCVGGMPNSPNKFTSLLKHHRIHMGKVWVDGAIRGIAVTWKDVDQFGEYAKAFAPSQPSKLKAVK